MLNPPFNQSHIVIAFVLACDYELRANANRQVLSSTGDVITYTEHFTKIVYLIQKDYRCNQLNRGRNHNYKLYKVVSYCCASCIREACTGMFP
jgi:hypothetical protein